MVWTYERVGSALSEYVTPSEPTELATESVGTLHDGTNVDTISAVSTFSTQFHATCAATSSAITSNHSHLPSYDAMSTNTTVLSRHPFHLSFSTSVQHHSSFKSTVQAWEQ